MSRRADSKQGNRAVREQERRPPLCVERTRDDCADDADLAPLERWFAARGWTPFDYQRQTWRAYLGGGEGLVHAPTGTGKTHAVWGGPLLEWLREEGRAGDAGAGAAPPLRVLWLTPLRALASDTLEAVSEPLGDLGIPWTVQSRTGDTSSSMRQRQKQRLPSALITTPESLCVLLSQPEAALHFAPLRCVIVDEWHELMGSKRGSQAELAIASLRGMVPALRVWGLSATLGNLDEAMATLLGAAGRNGRGTLIHADLPKVTQLETLLPDDVERFPWAGHLGTRLLPRVLAALEQARSTLVFTNTRSQAEIWFQAILAADPKWLGRVALHHGSLDRGVRQRVEQMLREGRLAAVVCTSSLDLGVDFSPVEQVIQIGSPKGIARMLQRAGRSGHQPGAVSRLLGVPTNALEIIEFAAAREAMAARRVEARRPLELPMDVLVQHLVTRAAGGGFTEDAMKAEVRSTHAFAKMTDEQWGWALDFVTRGGASLTAYPQFARVTWETTAAAVPGVGAQLAVPANEAVGTQLAVPANVPSAPSAAADRIRRGAHESEDPAGRPVRALKLVIASPRLARLHRMAIGTITSDSAVVVRFRNGRRLGSIEESFISRLAAGDRFVFAGRKLELLRLRDMTAWVKPAGAGSAIVPRWMGGRSPLSSRLADAIRVQLQRAREGRAESAELRLVQPLLDLQARWSMVPGPGELLVEITRSRDGHHAFLFPLEGRLVHEGLAALLAHRLTRQAPRSVLASANDYGLELLSPAPLPQRESEWRALLVTEGLVDDLLGCLNTTELARRRFRDIARVAGLITPGYPGEARPMRHIQASSSLFYEVFHEFDPQNLLLEQARREVLERELEVVRLRGALERIAGSTMHLVATRHFTPFSFPVWVDRMRSQQVSSEQWRTRVERMVAKLEEEAGENRK